MVCEMIVLEMGKFLGYKYYEVVMNLYVCLIYIKVYEIFEGDEELCECYKVLVFYFEELYKMY